jgi:Mn-dependent DtxR family transcriptional regulator
VTQDEMDELFALIDTIDVPPWRKRLAIERLRAKKYVNLVSEKRVELTEAAKNELGKVWFK